MKRESFSTDSPESVARMPAQNVSETLAPAPRNTAPTPDWPVVSVAAAMQNAVTSPAVTPIAVLNPPSFRHADNRAAKNQRTPTVRAQAAICQEGKLVGGGNPGAVKSPWSSADQLNQPTAAKIPEKNPRRPVIQRPAPDAERSSGNRHARIARIPPHTAEGTTAKMNVIQRKWEKGYADMAPRVATETSSGDRRMHIQVGNGTALAILSGDPERPPREQNESTTEPDEAEQQGITDTRSIIQSGSCADGVTDG